MTAGDPIAHVAARSEDTAERAVAMVRDAYRIGDDVRDADGPLASIVERIG